MILQHLEQKLSGLGVQDAGSRRDGQDNVFTIKPMGTSAAARLAILGRVLAIGTYMGESLEVTLDFDIDMATPTAVAPIGTALRNVLLPPKRRPS